MAQTIETLIAKVQNYTMPVRRQESKLSEGDILRLVLEIGRSITPDFCIDENNKAVYRNAALWLCGKPFTSYRFENGRIVATKGDTDLGLYIAGPTGTGKTTLTLVLQELARRVMALYQDANNTVHLQLWRSYHCEETSLAYGKEGEIRGLYDRCVVYQDLGAEGAESVHMGSRLNVMRYVIEKRADAELPTLITSNLRLGDPALVQRYGDRAVSRLMGKYNYLVLGGSDRRNQKK